MDSMEWIDYSKAYDMVPHSWIGDCIELSGIAKNVKNFLKDSMGKWKRGSHPLIFHVIHGPNDFSSKKKEIFLLS